MGVSVTELRAMVLADAPVVADLEADHRPRPWSEQVVRDELAQANRSYVVAFDGEVIGYGGVMVVGDESHVTNLLVIPEHRGAGLGRRLMVWLIAASREAGASQLTLEVRRSNHVARSLYHSLGFTQEGVRPGYYGDDDAVIMWRRDIDSPGATEGRE